MKTIHKWSAVRSGAGIRITGEDICGAKLSIKATSILSAEKNGGTAATAQADDGTFYRLP